MSDYCELVAQAQVPGLALSAPSRRPEGAAAVPSAVPAVPAVLAVPAADRRQ
jgi:hypothetical protein